MEKGQHLRLFITSGNSSKVVAMSTALTIHGTAQTENSTTKDTTDADGEVFNEYEVTGRSYTINFSALVGVGEDDGGKSFDDMLDQVTDTIINFKIALASGENNRTMGQEICSGQGKLTSVQATGQVGQSASYSGTINGFGPLVPALIIVEGQHPGGFEPVNPDDGPVNPLSDEDE